MSDKCGNCDCADKSQCVKRGSQYGIGIVETQKNYDNAAMMGVAVEENDCKCGCGPCGSSCSCSSCSCGCH
ncbi:hypothetical protein Ancab_031884 [Ancistrocladus abbreviatus]